MNSYVGQLVVLRSRWNIHSFRVGIVIEEDDSPVVILLVMWTDEDSKGIKLKYHLKDAILPIVVETIEKINERKLCATK